jgi:hypothetical protein
VRQTKTASAAIAALSLSTTVLLLGCTAQQPPRSTEPAATATPAAAAEQSWPVVEFGGQGRLSEGVAVPRGAKSLNLHFACTGGIFIISTGSDMAADRTGTCGGPRSYTLPVTYSANLIVSVTVQDDATFAVSGSFTPEETVPDAAIASDCEDLSAISTALANAREGISRGDIGEDDWLAVLGQVRADLTVLEKTAGGLIGQQVPALVAAVNEDHGRPDSLFESTPFNSSSNIISQVCGENGTPITILAKYGG